MRKSFKEWFMNDYLMQTNLSSPLLTGNKAISERQHRICFVGEKILINPNIPMEQLREEISLELFITLRCSLDYINYAKMLIKEWKK